MLNSTYRFLVQVLILAVMGTLGTNALAQPVMEKTDMRLEQDRYPGVGNGLRFLLQEAFQQWTHIRSLMSEVFQLPPVDTGDNTGGGNGDHGHKGKSRTNHGSRNGSGDGPGNGSGDGSGNGGDTPSPRDPDPPDPPEPPEDDEDCSKLPVLLAYGDKIERAVDLRVPVTGQTFRFVREYSSQPRTDLLAGFGLLGANWSSPTFAFVYESADQNSDGIDELVLAGSACEHITYLSIQTLPGTPRLWRSIGPTTQHIAEATVTIDGTSHDVLRLVQPGLFEFDFYAFGNDLQKLDGLPLQWRDDYGNTRTYEYAGGPLPGFDGGMQRPSKIHLNGTPGSSAEAVIAFTWQTDPNDFQWGRLTKAEVYRGTTVTQSVEYLYHDATPDDLGSYGDLIQVTKNFLVDDTESGTSPFRTRIWQYRYHSDDEGSTERSVTTERLDIVGLPHQLKAVFPPAQVEFYAQQVNEAQATQWDAEDALEEGAAQLLTLNDEETAPDWPETSAPLVIDVASKLISYETDDMSADYGRVVLQYVQSACGCGGGSVHGTKKAYTYSVHATTWRTTQIDDYRYAGTPEYEAIPYRSTYYDMEDINGYGAFFRRHTAVVETASPQREWVTRFDYDSSGNRIKMFSSAAIADFDPTASGSARVTLASGGLVVGMKYNSDNRVTEVRVSDGDHTSIDDFDLLSKTYYPTSPFSSGEKPYLPYRLDRFRTSVTSPPGDPSSDVETTWWTYAFHSGDALASIRTFVEAEAEAENGPASTSITDPEGLGIAVYDQYVLVDERGRPRWGRGPDGALIYAEYQSSTGNLTRVVDNADPSGTGSPNPALDGADYANVTTTGWGRFGDGDELTTSYERDDLGRVVKATYPGGVERFWRREMRSSLERPNILYFTTLEFPHKLGSSGFDGPAIVRTMNADERPIQIQERTVDAAASYDPLNGAFTFETNSMGHGEVSRATFQHTLSGLLGSARIWYDVGGVTGASSFYETAYEYDQLGRLEKITNDNGTVIEYPSHDVLDRTLEVRVGTTSVTPVTIAQYFYDDPDLTDGADQGMGNGNLNYIVAYTGDSTLTGSTRETKLYFDYRNRLVFTENEMAPHQALAYDNLGRIVKRAVFESVPTDPADPGTIDGTTDRGLFAEFAYSQRGLQFRQRVAIDPGNLAAGYIETHRWSDSNGRTIEFWGPTGPATKLAYDGLGRTKTAYITDRGGDALPGATDNYLDADDVSDDHVLQQAEYRYVAEEGLVDLATTRLRLHDDTGTGALTASGAVNTYVGYVYDAAQRVTHTVDFGTASANDVFEIVTTPPTVPSSIASSWWANGTYDDKIITGVTYNARGFVEDFIDGEGRTTRTLYDDLGRTIATIDNFKDAAISWSSGSGRWTFDNIDQTGTGDDARGTDLATSFLYDGSDNVVKQIAHLDDGSGGEKVQITEYVYDSSSTGSPTLPANNLLPSMDVLKEVRYPQESGVSAGQPGTTNAFKVRYAHNRLGELRSVTDQNGTIHSYERDTLGRTTRDRVGITSADIDDRIKAIGFTYDDLSRIDKVSSYDAATGGNVKNEVQFTYTSLWQVDVIKQDVDSAIDATGGIATETVDYDYATQPLATGNYSRLSGMDYPLEGTFAVTYGSSGSINDRISRAEGRNIASGAGFTYDYLGIGMTAVLDYADPDVQLDRTFSHDGKRRTQGYTTQAAGVYPGWDRFGRVQRQAWVDGALTTHATLTTVPNVPSILEQTYAYDRASNRLTNYDMRPGARVKHRSFEFEYDDLDRLIEARRGAWDGSAFTPSADTATKLVGQIWEYDPLGNWMEFRADLNGNGSYTDASVDRLDERTHNEANELTGSSRSPFGTFAYDDAGNVRQTPIAGGITSDVYAHDAWNRLVQVALDDGQHSPPELIPIAQYEYNGLHWRTIKRADADDAELGIDQERALYYDASWRLIEERIDDGWDPDAEPLVHADDRRAQQFWGLRYLDDAAIRRVRAYVNTAAPEDPPSFEWTDWEHFWYVTDAQFSVVALLDDVGDVVERVSYDAYGNARHRRPADLDGDRDVDTPDLSAYPSSSDYFIGDSGYSADFDLNRDGSEDDVNDLLNYLDWWFPGSGTAAVPDGHISETDAGAFPTAGLAVAPDNPIGYCGYVFNPETQLYLARNRWYSPVLGRWLERDPAGYVDGAGLYQYVASSPAEWTDAYGLHTDHDVAPGYYHGRKGFYVHTYERGWTGLFKNELVSTKFFPGTGDPVADALMKQHLEAGAAIGTGAGFVIDGVEIAGKAIETTARVLVEPVDTVMTGVDFAQDPSLATAAGFLPIVPGVAGKGARALEKCAKKADDALDAAEDLAKAAAETGSKIDRAAFRSEREAFWKSEAANNPGRYSANDLARMQRGKAPIGPDGHPMELHHVDRTPEGGVTPMSRTDHRLGENYKKNHP